MKAQAMRKLATIAFLLSTVYVAAQCPILGQAKTCPEVSLARQGIGASYKGEVRNDDYELRLTIPPGLTGWGADPVAPFHGFTIFLSDDGQSSCIEFEIHLRVNTQAGAIRHRGAKMMLGGATAWKDETRGIKNGIEFANISVQFTIARSQEIDDGTVIFVTPTRELGKNRRTFDAFLSGIKFGR